MVVYHNNSNIRNDFNGDSYMIASDRHATCDDTLIELLFYPVLGNFIGFIL